MIHWGRGGMCSGGVGCHNHQDKQYEQPSNLVKEQPLNHVYSLKLKF